MSLFKLGKRCSMPMEITVLNYFIKTLLQAKKRDCNVDTSELEKEK